MFSIIILTHNSREFVRPCLDSVFGQEGYKDFEVVVVDNASGDGTLELIKEYPKLSLIKNQKNLGACEGRNQGIEASRGDWILTLDCDVILEKDFLLKAAEEIRKAPLDIGIGQPKIFTPLEKIPLSMGQLNPVRNEIANEASFLTGFNCDKKMIYSCGLHLSWTRRFFDIGKNRKDCLKFNKPGYVFGACSAAAFYKRKMLEELKEKSGYFDQRFFFLVEDVDLAWRARKKGYKTLFLPRIYCWHKGNSSKTSKKLRQYFCWRNRFYSIAKNEGLVKYSLKIFPVLCYDLPRLVYLTLLRNIPINVIFACIRRGAQTFFSSVIPAPAGIQKKKIVIFNSGSFIYGAERGLINFVKAVRDKFKVIVVLPGPGPLENKIREIYPEVSIKIFPLAVLKSSLSPFYYLSFVFLLIIDVIYFSFFIIFKKIDIVCSNSLLLIFPAAAAKFTGRKNIWFIREFSPCRLLNRILGRSVEKLSDEVICQSETIKKELNIKRKAEIIYEPLDKANYTIYDFYAARKELNIPVGAKVMALISRIHPLKGQYEFIRAIKDILKKYQNLALVVAGGITVSSMKSRLYKRKILKLIEKEALKNVFFLGYVGDISKVICAADICIFPFRRKEPFGIAAAEALAFGKQTFFPFEGGLAEVQRIFQKGSELDTAKIIEAVSALKSSGSDNLEELFIPQMLSFSEYRNEIISLLENS